MLKIIPLRFFADSEKYGGAARRRVLTHLTPMFSATFVKISTQSCKVKSPGQVKWPNYKITFKSRHGYNVSGNVMKLSEYNEVISAYKTYILDFWYRWPQVLRSGHFCSGQVIQDLRSGHFCNIPIISQWAKNQLSDIYFGASLIEWNHIV